MSIKLITLTLLNGLAMIGLLSLMAVYADQTHAASVDLAWDASPSPGVTGHKIGIGKTDALEERTLLAANVTSATVVDLQPANTYFFGVKAYNPDTESVWSNIVSVVIPAAQAGTCPCYGFDQTLQPAVLSNDDSGAVELGVRFSSDVGGYITGIRFYKGTGNDGVHTGTLWANDGTKLATATFTNETATGWQQVNFDTPVAIIPMTLYVASYHAPLGRYASTANGFAAEIVNGSIHFPADTASNSNGVYVYGSGGVFPTNSYQATNYFVDVVFVTDIVVSPTPPTLFTVKSPLGIKVTFAPKWVTGTTKIAYEFTGGTPATSTRTTNGTSSTIWPGPGEYAVKVVRTTNGVDVTETKTIVLTGAGYSFK